MIGDTGSRGGGMRIGGFVDMSTIDWYGNVSLVVFFAGCNLRCPYCQNSSLIPMDSGTEVSPDYVRERLEMSRNLLDSVVLSGGEPLLQPDGIRETAGIAKEMGLKVMLNTNGTRPKVMSQLLSEGLIDRVALDIKAPLNSKGYAPFTMGSEGGKTFKMVKETLGVCDEHGVEVEARTTVASGVSDNPSFIRAIAAEIGSKCDAYCLQQFDNLGDVLSEEIKAMPPPSRERLIELANMVLEAGVGGVYIRTRSEGMERIG